MLRIAYALAIVTLIGGSAVMAASVDRDSRAERRAAFAMVTTLQR